MPSTELDPTLITRLSKFLTSDLLDELPEPVAVTQATQRLSSLYKTIASFLPSYIVENESLLTQDYGSLTPGTFMFADVSGFTALSELLMNKAGAEGIEILTQVFNQYFTTMLEILAKSEGQLLKFAGDAMLTFFPAEEGVDVFLRAVNTGLRMQRAMAAQFQPIKNEDLNRWFGQHNLQLTMSIGISKGELFEALVGNMAQRDHMIMGPLPGEAAAAEEAGERDDVIIPEHLVQTYQEVFDTISLENGFCRVVDNLGDSLGDYEFSMPQRRRGKSSFVFSFEDENLLEDLQNELTRVEKVSRFVSSEIVNKLVVKGDHIESENRLTTVIFVHFTGFAELLAAMGNRTELLAVILSRYYGIMQRVIATNGGVLTRSDPYKQGSKLLITFGAPVAHPDDADRAVATALEMNRQLEVFNKRLLEELPEEFAALYPFISQRMGITQGSAYAGEVGWKQRREYTVMGDDVNLAARLMAKAEFGQIVVNQTVWERIHTYFQTEALPPFAAKGKSEPIYSYLVTRTLKDTVARTSDTAFIGRDVTILSLNVALQQTLNIPKRIRVVGLHGDMGVGKTRLAKQVALTAESTNFTVAWATCRTQNNRKATWATLLTQLLELTGTPEEQEEILTASLEAMGLNDLKDILSDLLFNTNDQNKRETPKKESRAKSKARDDIFKKLSSERTLAMSKDEMAMFRQRMGKALGTTGAADLHFWNELQMRMSLTDAMMSFLRVYSHQQAVLIVIDDLHKENQRALNILKRLANEMTDARVMILVTYELPYDPSIDLRKIAVSDLPEEQTYLMATALLGASELGPRLGKFIWDSTSGRALFIESLIQALIDNEQLVEDQGVVELKSDSDLDALPNNVRGLIISRIDRLSTDTRSVLRAAAVLDDMLTLEALAEVSEIRDQTLVKRIIDNLIDLQIFEEQGNAIYRFRHGLTQQAIYEELTRTQRQRFHTQAADYHRQVEFPNIFDIIHHLLKSGATTRALTEIEQAAQQAEEANNLDQALELYLKAFEIFPNNQAVESEVERLQQKIRG